MVSRYCQVCKHQKVFSKPKVNHILHLLLTLITAGVWVFVWIGLTGLSAIKSLRCSGCGLPYHKVRATA